EPLPQADYYRLQAFFAPSAFRRDLPVATAADKADYDRAHAAYLARVKPVQDEIDKLEGPYRTKLFEAKLAKLSEEAQAAHRTPPEKRTGGQKELAAETARLVNVTAAEVAKLLSDDDRAKLKGLQDQVKALDRFKPTPLPMAMALQDDTKALPKTHVLG